MVERKMQITVSIYHHTDDIMCIGYISFILTAVQRPFGTPQCTFTYGQISIGIIIRYVLHIPIRYQRTVTEYSRIDGSRTISVTHLYELLC